MSDSEKQLGPSLESENLVDAAQIVKDMLDNPLVHSSDLVMEKNFRDQIQCLLSLYEATLLQERAQLARSWALLEAATTCLQLLNGAVLEGGVLPSRYYKVEVEFPDHAEVKDVLIDIEELVDTSPTVATPLSAVRRFMLIAGDLEVLTRKILDLKAAQKPCQAPQENLRLLQATIITASRQLADSYGH